MVSSDKINLSLLSEKKTEWGTFDLYVDEDHLHGHLSAGVIDDGIVVDDLKAVLEEFKIKQGIISEALGKIVELAREGKPIHQVPVANGIPVVEGTDARLNFLKQPSGQHKQNLSDEDRIDYREINTFDNVAAGDHIATFEPMVDGIGGTDIFGRVIIPKKLKDLKVEAGENVRYEEETNKYFALQNGFIEYEKHRVSVKMVYEVKNNLDFSHGNVRFIGRVEIGRDVPDDFEVIAKRGIFIGGTADACKLVSGTDIEIQGGMHGKERGIIQAKGNINIRFIDEARVEAEGDVIVQKEIVNSSVFALGRVIVEKGTIVGSEIIALKGIIVQDAGSELGVKTRLIAGMDYRCREKVLDKHKNLNRVAEKQQQMLNKAGPMIDKALNMPTVDNRLREEIDGLVYNIRGLQRQVLRLERESGELTRTFADDAVDCITVLGKLYSSVTAVVGRYEHVSESVLSGPLSFTPDEEHRLALMQPGNMIGKIWDSKEEAEDD